MLVEPMQTLESLAAKINSVEDLRSVVKTMKALAAVSIRQYERAVASLADYNRTIEMGLQILLRQRYFSEKPSKLPYVALNHPQSAPHLGAIIFGSDRGLCGQFNEQILRYAEEQLPRLQIQPEKRAIAAVGSRLGAALTASGQRLSAQFSVPSSVSGITGMVQEILFHIEQWQSGEQSINSIVLFYNQSQPGASCRPHLLRLLPLNRDWLHCLGQQPWPSQVLPTFTSDWERLFSTLLRQYLFVALYRAFAESLASENTSRLAAMQGAEKNIEERLSDFNAQYRHLRQSSITAELLDIVGGFEALNQTTSAVHSDMMSHSD